MNSFWNNFRMFLWMTFLTGVAYPLIIIAIAQLTMNQKANGDFITYQGRIIGAKLIAQKFQSDKYFWPRPSANDYNGLISGGSNFGPTSAALRKAVEERKSHFKTNPIEDESIPIELLFASGSGLDPHISPATAYFQIERIARSRSMNLIEENEIKDLIDKMIEKRLLRFIGEPCVNVLLLNMALDSLTQSPPKVGINEYR